jgi:hypothetical protein
MEGDLMRKFLKVSAIVALALLVAAPAMALDFKFGAEYRVRFYDAINSGFANVPGSNPRGVQVRVRPRFDVSDDNGNITATLRLEIGDIEWGNGGGAAGTTNGVTIGAGSARVGNGAGGQIDADGVNVETKWAYIDFASPGGIPLRVRAGIQPWFESKGLLVDTDLAGVRAYGKTGIASYELGWYRAAGGAATNAATAGVFCNTAGVVTFVATSAACTAAGGTVISGLQTSNAVATSNTLDNNYDFYEAKVGLAVAPFLNPTVYYIFGDNRAATPNGSKPVTAHFLGARIDGKANIFSYDLDFVFGTANGGPTGNYAPAALGQTKTVGWVADAGVHFALGPALLHVVASYATGDKQNGGKSEAMPYIAPGWSGAGGLYELVGGGGTFDQTEYSQDYPAGLWMLGAGIEYRPVKALWLRGMYGLIGFTSKRANCAYFESRVAGECFGPSYGGDGYNSTTGIGGLAGERMLGQEISFRADYDMWTNFKIQGAAGWLVPSEGKTVHEYVLQLYYNF